MRKACNAKAKKARCVQSPSADTCKAGLPSASVAPVHTRGGSGRGLCERPPCRTHTMADRQHAPPGVATVLDTLSSSTHHHPPWRQLSMPRVDRVDHVWRSLRISCRTTPLGGGVERHRCMSAVTTVPTRAGRCASCVSLVRPCAVGSALGSGSTSLSTLERSALPALVLGPAQRTECTLL